MADKPIIFSGSMVRAILAGRKTQTRRVLKPQPLARPEWHEPLFGDGEAFWAVFAEDRIAHRVRVPYAVGDRLWVKEGFARVGDNEDDIHACPDLRVHAYYRADAICPEHSKWRSPIFMPRWASRLTLEVTEVRVERLQDISCADAIAEGIAPAANSVTIDCDTPDPREEYRSLWNSIHGRDAWDANPWVAVLTFRPLPASLESQKEGAARG